MNFESTNSNQEEGQRAKGKYRIWQMTRPPFTKRHRQSKYEQINEREVFDFEWAVFFEELAPLNQFDSKYVHEAYHEVKSRSKSLKESIERQEQVFRFEEGPFALLAQRIRTKILNAEKPHSLLEETALSSLNSSAKFMKRLFKSDRHSSDQKEKRLLDAKASYYKMLSLETKDTDPKVSKSSELEFHKIETVSLAYQTLMTVRSFMHDPEVGIKRDSGEVKLQHVYEVSLHQMNRYLAKIKKEPDEDEKLKLIHEMKLAVVVALLHDFVEDHPHIPTDDLKGVLYSRTRFDSKIILRESNHRKHLNLPKKTSNFILDNWDEILVRVQALSKPEDENEKKGYLKRQMLENENLSENAKVEVIMTKLFDRHNNLKTLRYMKDKVDEKGNVTEKGSARQSRKIGETVELLDLAFETYTRYKDNPNVRHVPDLLKASKELIQVCFKELNRIRAHQNTHKLSIKETATHQLHIQVKELELNELLTA